MKTIFFTMIYCQRSSASKSIESCAHDMIIVPLPEQATEVLRYTKSDAGQETSHIMKRPRIALTAISGRRVIGLAGANVIGRPDIWMAKRIGEM